jgi:hypothetical protein
LPAVLGRRRWWLLGIVVVVLIIAGAAAVGYLTRHTAKTGVARGLAAVRLEKGIGSSTGGSVSPVTCSLYKYGDTVRLTLEGTGTEDECEEVAQAMSGSGRGYWVNGTPPLEEGLETVCALDGPKGGMIAIVEDRSSYGEFGTTLCGNLSHNDWTADPNPPAEGPQALAYNEAKYEEEEREREQVRRAEVCRERIEERMGENGGQREYEALERCG